MMVSAATAAMQSTGSSASPSIAKAADQNPAQGTTTATDNAAQPTPAAPQAPSAAPQTTAQAPVAGDAAVDPRTAQAADTASRFSDMLRAANDDDATEPTAADPKTGSAGASKDDGHADAAAADTALALAQWPGMAMPVTVVPPGVPMPVPSPAANGAAGGQAATDGDAASVAAVQTGRAAPVAADPTGTAPATVAAAAAATTKPSADANAGSDEDADGAVDATTAAPSRRTAGFHNLSDDASAVSDSARTSARPDAAAAGTRERAATTTTPPGSNTNAGANTAPMSSGWSAPVNGNANADAGQTVTVKLPPQSPEQWRQPLTEALGDRLQLQLGRNSEQATIRLDPPMLGSIEISIRHEAGSLQVQLSASNGEVLRQLHGIGDSLRQDLSQRQGDVSVVVSDSSRNATNADQQRGRERDAETPEDGPGRALAEAESETGSARTPFSLARERE